MILIFLVSLGGQKQRVALSRAILRDPSILVLVCHSILFLFI